MTTPRRLTAEEMAAIYPPADVRAAISVLFRNPAVNAAQVATALRLHRGEQPARIFVRAILRNLGGTE
jgi:hypothetical protein